MRPRIRGVRRGALIAVGLAVLLTAAAAALRLAARPGPLAVPTDPSLRYDSRGDYGLVEGTLRASRSGNRACFWVETPPGSVPSSKVRTHRYYLVMPTDWSADGSLRLLQSFQQVVALPGEKVAFLGAPGDVTTLPGCGATGVPWSTPARYQPGR